MDGRVGDEMDTIVRGPLGLSAGRAEGNDGSVFAILFRRVYGIELLKSSGVPEILISYTGPNVGKGSNLPVPG